MKVESKKKGTTSSAVFLAVALMAACGGDDGSVTSPLSTTAPLAAAAAPTAVIDAKTLTDTTAPLLIPQAGTRTYSAPVETDSGHEPSNYKPAPVVPKIVPATSDPTGGVLTFERETAPLEGWHAWARNGAAGTHRQVLVTGGSSAAANRIYTVFTKEQLVNAIREARNEPKIIRVVGHIDFRVDGGVFREYTSYDDLKNGGTLFIPSNTTLVGINDANGKPAKISGTQILIGNENANFELDFKAWVAAGKNPDAFPGWTRNVIVRNLAIDVMWDVNPEDSANAYADGICVSWAQNVWIDHITLTDLPTPSSMSSDTRHDGGLDVVRGSDYVTISNSHFTVHGKMSLVGNSDGGRQWSDEGRLHVTFTGNHWEGVNSRTPRVRYGQVHIYNNLVTGDTKPSVANGTLPAGVAPSDVKFESAIGVGFKADILAENNYYNMKTLKPKEVCGKLVVDHGKGVSFRSKGARFLSNKDDAGKPMTATIDVELQGCDGIPVANLWTPPYGYTLKTADDAKAEILANVGAGKL
ncbi:pectate lyase precursor [Archangium minus]|uniref:Pectate lyase n=1 Tax=Archangium minus TaxID=83450 RepID=A0ABY9WQ36_9BACT|nr:pectate lyase precursor [Archangium minus]